MKLFKYFYDNDQSGLTPLAKDEYEARLVNIDKESAKRAFEKAWEIRNFEIELYWKRATYFWAFIASSFVGYFALVSSVNYTKPDKYNHVEVYFLVCIGFILSVAWLLTNLGSKAWQRHWEVHVDLLEDNFTGPLHKTVHPTITYSVSKINEIVSCVFIVIWFLLGVKYLAEHDLLNFGRSNIEWFALSSTASVLLALLAMFCGYGRGRFTKRNVVMSKRAVSYNSEM